MQIIELCGLYVAYGLVQAKLKTLSLCTLDIFKMPY
jgi:hypothetical protein